jgi:hypothetical protein
VKPGAIRISFLKIARQKDFLINSAFIKQVREKKTGDKSIAFLISLLGMCVFPLS